ncbi:hypothetical protein Zmor_020431 [Zophobas morio]|uniref:Gustatory receptor n=1 Tax=Zophobas morio TaxID=2755281 RepID=A0AA38I345_9CUCU|nr:hypothetical protein Zmor_020431 [Zophobas morio]
MCLILETPIVLHWLYKLLGIVQFSLKPSPSRIHDRLYCLPFYFLFLYTWFYYSFILHRNTSGIVNLLKDLTNIETFLYVVIGYLCFYTRSSNLRSLILRINTVKEKTVAFSTRKAPLNKWIRINSVTLFFLTVSFIPFITKQPINFIYPSFSQLLIVFDVLFLNDVMHCIYAEFESINRHLHRQINSVSLSQIFPLTRLEKIKTLEDEEIASSVEQVHKASHLHYELVKIAVQVSKCFEITIIFSLLLWFEHMIDDVYYLVDITITGRYKLIDYVYNGALLSNSFYWLFVMIRIFVRVKSEANNTSTFVHDMWNKWTETSKSDCKIRHLQLVSMRLLNTKVHFTAGDLFSLDWSLGHMLVAAVTTYVVILIQFNKST